MASFFTRSRIGVPSPGGKRTGGLKSGVLAIGITMISSNVSQGGAVSNLFHSYEPRQGHRLPHDPFNMIVGPRPIGWISTRGVSGGLNLRAVQFFQRLQLYAAHSRLLQRRLQRLGAQRRADAGVRLEFGDAPSGRGHESDVCPAPAGGERIRLCGVDAIGVGIDFGAPRG